MAGAQRRCYCRTDDEDRSNDEYFAFQCGHALHRYCARKRLRLEWKRATKMETAEGPRNTVDADGRRVVRIACPACGTSVCPDDVRRLQATDCELRASLTLFDSVPEALYAFYVEVADDSVPFCQVFRVGDMLEDAGVDFAGHRARLLEATFAVKALSLQEEYVVVVQKEWPEFVPVFFRRIRAADLVSMERDSTEEAEQNARVDELMAAGRLRLLTEQEVDDEYLADMERMELPNENDGDCAPLSLLTDEEMIEETPPPSPSFRQLKNLHVERLSPSTSFSAAAAAAGPSTKSSCSWLKVENANKSKKRKNKVTALLEKISNNIRTAQRAIDVLSRNLNEWGKVERKFKRRNKCHDISRSMNVISKMTSVCESVYRLGDVFRTELESECSL